MPKRSSTLTANAVYPLDDSNLVILLREPVANMPRRRLRVSSDAGLKVRSLRVDPDNPTRIFLATKSMATNGVVVDSLRIEDGLASPDGGTPAEVITPKFIHGVKDPTELKALQLEPEYHSVPV